MPNKQRFAVLLCLSILGFAALFILIGGLTSGYSPRSVLFSGTAGFFIGAIAAPEFEPALFRYPTLWQIVFAVLGCNLVAAFLDASAPGYGVATIVGVLLGYFARHWIAHVSIP